MSANLRGVGLASGWEVFFGNSLLVCPARPGSIHCVSTSPGYFRQRVYGKLGINDPSSPSFERRAENPEQDDLGKFDEIGREADVAGYLENLLQAFSVIKPCLHKTATVWINVKNPRKDGELIDVSGMLVIGMKELGYKFLSRTIWYKSSPPMDPSGRRPVSAYEEILVFSVSGAHFYDSMAIRHGNRGLFDVWEIPKVYQEPEAIRSTHPARQNIEIASRAILLGTSQRGVCPICLNPWHPKISRQEATIDQKKACGANSAGEYHGKGKTAIQGKQTASDIKRRMIANMTNKEVTGWSPSCSCGIPHAIPALVYDPFLGSGTTLMAAGILGREGLGQELYGEQWEGELGARIKWGYDGGQPDLDGQLLLTEET